MHRSLLGQWRLLERIGYCRYASRVFHQSTVITSENAAFYRPTVAPGSLSRKPTVQMEPNANTARPSKELDIIPPLYRIPKNVPALLRRANVERERFGRIDEDTYRALISCVDCDVTAADVDSIVSCAAHVAEVSPEARIELLHSLIGNLVSSGFAFDINHYNNIISIYNALEYSYDPHLLLSKLQQAGIEPNRVTAQRLLVRYAQMGQVEQATRVLKSMKDSQISINPSTISALILAYARLGDFTTARNIRESMEGGRNPDAHLLYEPFIIAYAEKDDFEGILRIIDEAEAKSVSIPGYVYLNLAVRLAKLGKHEHFDNVVELAVGARNTSRPDIQNAVLQIVTLGDYNLAFDFVKHFDYVNAFVSYKFFLKFLARQKNLRSEVAMDICEKVAASTEKSLPEVVNFFKSRAVMWKNDDLLYELLTREMLNQPMLNSDLLSEYVPIISRMIANSNESKLVDMFKKFRESSYNMDATFFYRNIFLSSQVSLETVLSVLEKADLLISIAAYNGYLLRCLKENDVQSVTRSLDDYNFWINLHCVEILHRFLYATESVDTVIKLLRKYQNRYCDPYKADQAISNRRAIGKFVENVISFQNHSDYALLRQLLPLMLSHNIGVTMATVPSTLPSSLKSILSELENVKLESVNQYYPPGTIKKWPLQTVRNRLKETNYPPDLRESITDAYLNDASASVKQELLAITMSRFGHNLPVSDMAMLFSFCIELEDSKNALFLRDELLKRGGFIKREKFLSLVAMLAKAGKIDDLVDVVSSQNFDEWKTDGRLYHNIEELILSQKDNFKNLDDLIALVDLFVRKANFFMTKSVSNMILSALCQKGDLNGALTFYSDVSRVHSNRACDSVVFYQRLIEAGDSASGLLQNAVVIDSKIRGEMQTTLNLVFAFCSAGVPSKAKNILENSTLPNFEVTSLIVRQFDHWISVDNNVACANFLRLLLPMKLSPNGGKSVQDLDFDYFTEKLMSSFKKNNLVEPANQLWLEMQDSGLTGSNQCMLDFSELLNQNGLTVPFSAPTQAQIDADKSVKLYRLLRHTAAVSEKLTENDVNGVLGMLQNDGVSYDQRIYSDVLAHFLKHLPVNDYKNLAEIVLICGNRGIRPTPVRNLLMALDRIAKSGDVSLTNTLVDLYSYIEPPKKREHFRMTAAIASGYMDDVLEKLINDTKLGADSVNDPSVTLLTRIIETDSSSTEKVLELGKLYLKRPVSNKAPFVALWQHYMKTCKFEAAKQLIDEYKLERSDITVGFSASHFRPVRNAEEILRNFLEMFPMLSASEQTEIYSNILSIRMQEEDLEGCKELLNEIGSKSLILRRLGTKMLNNLRYLFEVSDVTVPPQLEQITTFTRRVNSLLAFVGPAKSAESVQ